MGKKSKRKTPENDGCEDTADGQGTRGDDQPAEGAATTPSKRHKKSKEKDRDVTEHPTHHSLAVDEQKMDKKEKKKKKRKAGEDRDVEEDVKPSKPKKQRLASEKDSSEKISQSESTGDCSSDIAEAVRNGSSKKKKKKKSVVNEECAVSATLPTDTVVNGSISQPEELTMEMNSGDGNATKSSKVCKKHKKEKKKSKQQDVVTINGSDAFLETDPQEIIADSSSQKKKKGKSKDSKVTPLDSNVGTTEDDSTPKKEKKKKHKHSKSDLQVEASENGLGDGSQENGTDSSEPKMGRKKEKKAKLTADENEEKGAVESNISTEHFKEKKQQSEGINPVELDCEDSTEITNQKKKSKKKKKSRNVEENTDKTETADSCDKDLAAETKRKKKKRKSKDKEQNPEQETTADWEAANENAETADQKQKDSGPFNPGETRTDSGQTDSGQNQSAPPATIGQWSTTMFKDSERQSKFLRLLGGFKKAGDGAPAATAPKKGLFGSLQLKQDPTVSGQRALTHQAAHTMNRRLESDYERALTFSARGQRGIGLGFTPDPAEGKKFHIDVGRVASKKFD